jgi:hypothetical protein
MKKRTVLWVICALVVSLVLPAIGQGATLSYLSGELTIAGAAFAGFGADSSYQSSSGPVSGVRVEKEAHAYVEDKFTNSVPADVVVIGFASTDVVGFEIHGLVKAATPIPYPPTYDFVPPFVAYGSGSGSTSSRRRRTGRRSGNAFCLLWV